MQRRVLLALVVLCLAAPTLWMLSSIPPLWRDVDGYTQVTARPGPTTLLLHGPLYCFAARVPLYLGAPARASLSDGGVFALLLTQHAMLLGAQLFWISTLAGAAWLRLLLAALCASHPLLYTFAHSVGSEALSATGTIVLVALGLRIVRSQATAPRLWAAFGILLTSLILTRHINTVLAALLPIAFLLLLVRQRERRAVWRRFLFAVALGLTCLVTASLATRALCLATKVPYRSKVGFTFLWRLHFLQTLAPAEQSAIIDAAAVSARTTEGKEMVRRVGKALPQPQPFDVLALLDASRASVFPVKTGLSSAQFDAALNDMARAFARAAFLPLAQAALHDFRGARQSRSGDVTLSLFDTTAYFFEHREQMPQAANLSTFRSSTAEEINALPNQHRYFRWWSGVTADRCLLACLALLAATVIRRRSGNTEAVGYAATLLAIGLLMMLLNCFVTELLPRYALPLLQLSTAAVSLLLANVLEPGPPRGA